MASSQDVTLEQVTDYLVKAIFTDKEITEAPAAERAARIAARFNSMAQTEAQRQIAEAEKRFSVKLEESQEAMRELQQRLARGEAWRSQNTGLRRMTNGMLRPEVSDGCARAVAEAVRDSMYAKRDVGQHSSGVAAEGGVMIAPEYAAEIVRLIPTFGLYPRVARNFPMTQPELNLGKLLAGLRMSYPNENAKINRTYASLGPLQLKAKLVAGMTDAPRTLLSDASVELGNLYIDLMMEGLAGEYDFQGWVAKVSDGEPWDGVLNKTGTIAKVTEGKTSILKSSVYDLLPMQTAVPDGARENCIYVMNPTLLDHYRAERTSDGAPLNIVIPPTAGSPGTIFGRPYEVSEKFPSIAADGPGKRFVWYGNPKFLFFGDMQEITVERSTTAGEAFERHQELFKVTNRFAVASHAEATAALETDN